MNAKNQRVSQALADAGQSEPTTPTPPTPGTKRERRSPTDVQRDRLTERISRLEEERRVAAHEAREAIKLSAADDLNARLNKSDERIRYRYSARIEPLQRMLSALTAPAEKETR